SPAWYGFVLIVPTYALIAYVLFVRWPSRAWLFLVAMICARDLWEQHERWGVKIYPIVTARGTFYDHNADRARALSEFIRSAGVSPAGGAASRRPATETVADQPARTPALPATLAVFPEGITINYLTRTTTPL